MLRITVSSASHMPFAPAEVADTTMLGGRPVPSKWIQDTTSTNMALDELLNRSASELADVLSEWDDDKSGTVDKREFIRAFNSMFGTGENWATDKKGATAIFDKLDKDKSGTLEIAELRNLGKSKEPKATLKPAAKASLPKFNLDPESNTPVTAQLRDFLKAHKKRVLDLFKSWDDDEDSLISRAEFHRAMTMLGVRAHPKVIDGLFNAFDMDGSGEIDYKEFERALVKSDLVLNLNLAPKEEQASMPL